MKKFISVLLSLLIFITCIFIYDPIRVNAADTTNRNYIVCNGYYVRDKGSYQIRLDITGIDFENEEFKGLFTVSGSKTYFQEITGIFKTKDVQAIR